MTRILLAVLLTLWPATKVWAQLPTDLDPAWRSLVAEHRRLLDSEGIVGSSLAFVHDGEVVATDYYGMADLESRRPVDENTIYHWASVTKTFTAVGIMQLRDLGLLELDDPAIRYVPELRQVHNPYGSMESIRLRHLLSHSAGFRAGTWPWGGDRPWHPHEPTEWSQLAGMLPYTEILFPPGSRYSYSNPGIVFLGRTIEALTSDHYETQMAKNIFTPLKMYTNYFDWTPRHLLHQRSNSYRVIDGEPVPNGIDFDTGITVSNGGLNATVGDMARWVSFLMGAPATSRAVHDQVLSRSTLEEMWQPIVSTEKSSELGPERMGLSFFIYEDAGRRIVGHTGSQKSFISFIFIEPETKVGLIGIYNTAGGDETAPDTEMISERARRLALDHLFPLFRRSAAIE